MASTAKVSISVADPDLLAWAKKRSKRTGMSLSALFTEAVRFERQMEARKLFLEAEGLDGRATPKEMEEIRAEWGASEPSGRPRRRALVKAKGRASVARTSKRKR